MAAGGLDFPALLARIELNEARRDATSLKILTSEAEARNATLVLQDEESTETARRNAQSALQASTQQLAKLRKEVSKLTLDIVKDIQDQTAHVTRVKQEANAAGGIPVQPVDPPAAGGLAPQVQPVAPVSVQGSQQATIPQFSGVPGEDAEGWVKLVARAKIQFNWSSMLTAQTVRQKLTGSARLWADCNDAELKPGMLTWDEGEKNLKQLILDRFSITVSAVAAAHSLDNLKQRAEESVDEFYDRVRYAVEKILTNEPKTTAEERTAFLHMFKMLCKMYFHAGMLARYREGLFNMPVANQPKDAEELLEAARSAELEAGRSKKEHKVNTNPATLMSVSSDAVSAPEPSNGKDDAPCKPNSAPVEAQIEALRREFQSWTQRSRGGRGRGRGAGRANHRGGFGGHNGASFGGRGGGGNRPPRREGNCYQCNQPGHWADRCPESRRQNPRMNEIQQYGNQYDFHNDSLNYQGGL